MRTLILSRVPLRERPTLTLGVSVLFSRDAVTWLLCFHRKPIGRRNRRQATLRQRIVRQRMYLPMFAGILIQQTGTIG